MRHAAATATAAPMTAADRTEATGPARTEAEQSIVQGLLYLEQEASAARLVDLAHTIRAAVDLYTRQSAKECEA